MKAIISSTYDDKYLFFLPIIRWCWARLNVDVICFMPHPETEKEMSKYDFVAHKDNYLFFCPENKKSTYAQCSRLYASALNLPENELLITSDIDMAVFKTPPYIDWITIFGADLTPKNQFPICYATGTVKTWRKLFEITPFHNYENMLDSLLGDIECENMRGNYWGKDQQELYDKTWEYAALMDRARPNTQFAANRVDRDDTNWRSYLGPDLIDAHLWRPGYTDENFANIMELLTAQYPNESFQWLIDYKNAYTSLL